VFETETHLMLAARRPRRPAALLSIFAVVVTAASVVVAADRPAQATESYPAAADGSFLLSGHGFGHGRGMSQWGAYGMATEGQNAQQILAFYYPTTQLTTLPTNPMIRVLITGGAASTLTIVGGLGDETVTDTATNTQLALPAAVGTAAVSQWQASRVGSGPTALTGFWQGAWHPFPVAGQLSTTGTLQFASSTGTVRMVYPNTSERDYQGVLSAVPVGALLFSVNTLDLEDYLKGVVPHESINSWPAAALQAQAVAARTYADVHLGGTGPYDICDSSACQVYLGYAGYDGNGNPTTPLQFPESDAAIAAVAGQILTSNGAPILAEYSSSNGGWSVNGGVPWEPAQPDPYDHYSPDHDWTQTVTAAQLQTAFPSVGAVTGITINQRDGNGDLGGRVLSLTLTGSSGNLTMTGDAFRIAMGLRSTWWTVGGPPPVSGYLHPIVPTRVLDTRTIPAGPFGQGETRAIQIAGLAGVPADAVGVVLNVTATDTTSVSYLTVWPRPYSRPPTSNLDWDHPGETAANLVYTALGPDGTVLIYNNAGTASVVIDVFCYFEPTTVAGGLGFTPVTPDRVLDTRLPTAALPTPAPIGTAAIRSVAVTGTPGVDPDAQAVLVNLTATAPTAFTYLTLFPTGDAQPGTSNLDVLPGATLANAAIGLLGGGSLSVYNNLGTTHAIIDVLGEYVPGDGVTGQFVSAQPIRILDTRTTTGGHPGALAAGETYSLQVLGAGGVGGVPSSGVSAVVLNVTAVSPTQETFVTAWPSGIGRPPTSNLDAAPGSLVPNLVVSGVGPDGKVDLYNNSGSTNLVVDVAGWISG
jgi:SpoIID/LytB domain protein